MAFKVVNDIVINNDTNINVDGMDVLVGDGDSNTKVLLQNVQLTTNIFQDSNLTTDNLTEGTSNLYFNNLRAQAALAGDIATLQADIANAIITSNSYTDAAVSGGTGSLTTDDIPEGVNLYYTNARVDARIPTTLSSFTNDNNFATEAYSDQSELDANLYTDTRETAITSAYTSAIASASSSNSSGSNAYTDQEVATAITTMIAYTDQSEVDAKAYTDIRETAITTAYQTYADTAEADAISTAATDATTKADVAQAAAEATASTDATTKADAAQAAAEATASTDATTKATAAQAAAISTAATDATTKADAAQAAAISTAATDATTKADVAQAAAEADATTKADAALVAAKAYADSAETDAVTAANVYTDAREVAITTAYQTYSDQSEVDAKAYTDIHATAITTAYELYTDQAEVDAKAYTDIRETAITTAYESYADQAEVDAISTANSYTDSAVANVVDSAPAVLDTLNELAAALGDDANFATTVSNDIGTKVSKAGDTMTGDLTLAGAPSSANHATTKAYVDSAVSGGTGVLDTDDISEAGNLYYTNARVDARIPTNVSSFTNDSSYATTSQLFSGSYTDLSNKPTIPTNNNQLTNGAGYITSFTDTNTTYTAGTGLTLVGTEFRNTSPDQTVSLTGSGATSISGTYPNFTISSTDTNTDTNTTYTAGTGLTLVGTEFRNTSPDQTVSLTGSGATSISGTYPNFTISSTDTNTNTTYSTATSSTLGLVKIGYGENGKNYPVELSSGKMFVNVPWTDTNTNTTYSDGNGIGLSSTTFSVSAGNGLTQTADGLEMSGSYTGTFTASGDICAYSDKRLKRNIQTIDNALDTVHNLRGVTFEKSLKPSIGVIAQEVEEVLPELVNTDADGMKSVAYGNMVGLLIEAIKEQQNQIEELKNKCKDL